MSEQAPTPAPPPAEPGTAPSVAARLAIYQRAGGIVTPLITALLAFLIAGLVVLVLSGKNPLSTYKEIFNGTGLNWLFPWDSTCSVRDPGDELCVAAGNLQQTLIQFTVLVLTGLAVAFAFRCGLFNIGGQGQYIVGTITAVQIGVWFDFLPSALHILAAVVAAGIAGAVWAGIAGFLKATVGAHEVITTIMLNWIAIWGVGYLIGFG
jgi:general nucleoside transport system permease protein